MSTALFDHYIAATGVDGICCDTACPLSVMQRIAKTGTVVQGNLDPLLLASGGAALDQRIDDICAAMTGLPFVFNLGHARGWAYRDRDGFRKLIDILTDASIEYLCRQVSAGADALQIFDSWAGSLADDEFELVNSCRVWVE